MKNFFSILFLITTCLTAINAYAAQRSQNENEKVVAIKAQLINQINEENKGEMPHNFTECFYEKLVNAGFSQLVALNYAFDTTKNN